MWLDKIRTFITAPKTKSFTLILPFGEKSMDTIIDLRSIFSVKRELHQHQSQVQFFKGLVNIENGDTEDNCVRYLHHVNEVEHLTTELTGLIHEKTKSKEEPCNLLA